MKKLKDAFMYVALKQPSRSLVIFGAAAEVSPVMKYVYLLLLCFLCIVIRNKFRGKLGSTGHLGYSVEIFFLGMMK
jgi:hypothetical protein